MCGIVGYIGDKTATEVLISGLSRLEYRGYDSAGVSVLSPENMITEKSKGKLKNLEELIEKNPIDGNIGIGHTRWATHGEPSDVNSHPHYNESKTIAVVHNGIIENYLDIKEKLKENGYKFLSDTDTEVIVHLIDHHYTNQKSIKKAIKKAILELRGSFALGVISTENPNELIAIRKDSPLIVGSGKNENFIASDIPAILNYTKDVYLLEDLELVTLKKDSISIEDLEGNKINREIFKVTWDAHAAEKDGYPHFMLKEIYEQPKAIKDTMTSRIMADSDDIVLDNIKITKKELSEINKIFIVACGTAYHAGLLGKYVIEKMTKIPVEVDVASEFRYREPIINQNTLMIVISQSGETADTLAALREAKKKGARVIAVTNVVGSSVDRESDDTFYTWAGPEIAVASTKAYTTQLISMYIIALYLGKLNGMLSKKEIVEIKNEMLLLPEKVDSILSNVENIKYIAENNCDSEDAFFIGRGLDYYVALEGALKLKEISYIHAEAYAAGELKHGPIALVDKGIPIFSIATQEEIFEKTLSNIKEVVTRGGKIIAVALKGQKSIEAVSKEVVYIPKTISILTPILSVIPLQVMSYYIAVARGCDVDKPKNLAKSVTVE